VILEDGKLHHHGVILATDENVGAALSAIGYDGLNIRRADKVVLEALIDLNFIGYFPADPYEPRVVEVNGELLAVRKSTVFAYVGNYLWDYGDGRDIGFDRTDRLSSNDLVFE
jgi:hypothetical protein